MRFNFFTRKQNETVNYAGAQAFVMSPEQELYAAVATTSLNDTFYEKGNDRMARIIELMSKCEPAFVAKLAYYTRNEMYLRSIPLVLTVELAKFHSGDNLVARTVNGVVQRVDEITELLAYYQIANKRIGTKKLNGLSKQLQKGLAAAFNKFDAYQFAKYDRATEVKLRDALFIVHPKAKGEDQQAIFDKIANKELATPYTWETELSALGQQKFESEKAKQETVAAKWEALIFSGKLGYMALLRNLRNILDANVSYVAIDQVCTILSDRNAVMKSKQLPFRFLSAYRELLENKSDATSKVLTALEDAVLMSAANIKGFENNTSVLIACDVSGSMQTPISAKSKVLLYDIGLMLAILLQSRCDRVVTGMFGDRWKVVNLSKHAILSNVQQLYKREGEVGYSTNGYLVIEGLIRKNKMVDKVMIFTDCQLWDSKAANNTLAGKWNTYKAINPTAKLYLFDLAGYGQAPINLIQKDVYLIAGWSDKVFDVLDALENTSNALDRINVIKL